MSCVFIGPTGGLISLPGASSLQASPAWSRYSTDAALDGSVWAQDGGEPPRVWDATVATATPEEAHRFRQLVASQRAQWLAPFWYYSEEAVTSNILTPAASMLEPGTFGGTALPFRGGGSSVQGDGPSGVHYLSSAVATQRGRIDLALDPAGLEGMAVPGRHPFSVSAIITPWSGVNAVLSVIELDLERGVVHHHQKPTAGTTAGQVVSISGVTNGRTTTMLIRVTDALMVAAPGVPLTREPLPWAIGEGARRVIVTPGTRDVQRATDRVWDRRSQYNYTVQEVGARA